jgi:enterochelin esterase-like enzyme
VPPEPPHRRSRSRPWDRKVSRGVALGLLIAAFGVPALLGLLVESADDEPVGAHFRSKLGARIGRFELRSAATGKTLQPVVVRPPGASPSERRPLLVLLHGRGMPPEFFLADGLFQGLRDAGPRAPVVVLVDGTLEAPWHDRADGAWGRMVADEAIPAAVKNLNADPRRVAIGGISLGGFGALDLAGRDPRRFCAVGAHSPALWAGAREAPPSVFDDARDFAEHDVLARARAAADPFGALPVWIDRGDGDRFRAVTDRLVRTLRARDDKGEGSLRFRAAPGGHDGAYWDAHMAEWVAFYATQLARCRR